MHQRSLHFLISCVSSPSAATCSMKTKEAKKLKMEKKGNAKEVGRFLVQKLSRNFDFCTCQRFSSLKLNVVISSQSLQRGHILVTLQECQECGIFLPITVHRTPAIENHRLKLGLRSPSLNAIIILFIN